MNTSIKLITFFISIMLISCQKEPLIESPEGLEKAKLIINDECGEGSAFQEIDIMYNPQTGMIIEIDMIKDQESNILLHKNMTRGEWTSGQENRVDIDLKDFAFDWNDIDFSMITNLAEESIIRTGEEISKKDWKVGDMWVSGIQFEKPYSSGVDREKRELKLRILVNAAGISNVFSSEYNQKGELLDFSY
ncbi:hypothetical protein [Aquimarina sp. Aq78]|uniref:hypothetical protein n=1 Tax=Aquimarina sp. Aq78 TaxID=1191889 RepID=UPI00131C8CFF|nr:hypothetical protein [Aquimarina sp. Aq78]